MWSRLDHYWSNVYQQDHRSGCVLKNYSHFSSACLATLLQCKLKLSVARITTRAANSSRNKMPCCKLKRRVAKTRLEFYFLQQILVLLLVLPLKLQLVSQQIWLQRLWLAVSEVRLRGKLKKNVADAADGENEFSFLLDQRRYFSQQKAKLLLGHAEKLFIRHDIPHFNFSYQLMKHAPLLSPGNPLSHIHFLISFSRPFLVFAVQKAQTESGKRSLPTEKELSSHHLCLRTTDQSYVQDSANLQQYVLLRNKLVTQVVIRATESFNLHRNNVARQIEEKCCPYYRTFIRATQSCRPNMGTIG